MFKLHLKKYVIKFTTDFIILVFNILRSLKNSLEIILIKDNNNFYIPNYLIKNIIFIDPKKVKLRNSIPMKHKRKSTLFIFNFNWDQNNKNLSDFEKYDHVSISCEELFVKGFEINQCKEYLFFKKYIKDVGEIKNCTNENDILKYFENLIKTFNNIKNNGIKSIKENNIEFMIDRNSNLVKINGGNHRFFISRILELKSVPVEVKLIHSNCFKNKISSKNINKFLKDIEINYK